MDDLGVTYPLFSTSCGIRVSVQALLSIRLWGVMNKSVGENEASYMNSSETIFEDLLQINCGEMLTI